jgi:hypothetical protein
MATEGQLLKFSAVAAADLSAKQYRFVKFTANRTVDVCAAATDKPCGVLQNKPASGQVAEVGYLGETKLEADASLTAGTLIGTSADGQADAKVPGTDTTEYIAGQIVQGAGAAGEIGTALINCAAIGRAA